MDNEYKEIIKNLKKEIAFKNEEIKALKAYNLDLVDLNKNLEAQLDVLAKFAIEHQTGVQNMAERMFEKIDESLLDVFSLGQGKDIGEA
jgi:hypothetical protein